MHTRTHILTARFHARATVLYYSAAAPFKDSNSSICLHFQELKYRRPDLERLPERLCSLTVLPISTGTHGSVGTITQPSLQTTLKRTPAY